MVLVRWICWLIAIGMWSSTLLHADLIVDDFSTPQSVNNTGGFGGSSPGGGLFGGSRLLNLQVTNSTQQLEIAAQKLDLSVTPLNTSFFHSMTLTYNDAVPSQDLAAANAVAISLADVQATAPWTVTVSFTGTNSATPATRTVSIPDGFNSSLVIPFTTFNNSVTGLGPISSISLHFGNDSGAAPKLSLGPVTLLTTAPVPEPSVMLLATLSLAGVLVRRRRLKAV